MKLSISVTPEAFYKHGCERIVALGFATEAQLKKSVSAGWSKYIQMLVRQQMEAEGKWPPGIHNPPNPARKLNPDKARRPAIGEKSPAPSERKKTQEPEGGKSSPDIRET